MDERSLSGPEKMRLLWWLGAVSIAKKHNIVLRPTFHHIDKVMGDIGLGRSLLHQVISRVFPNFKVLNTGSGIEIHIPDGPVRDLLNCVTAVKYVTNGGHTRKVTRKIYPMYRSKLHSEEAIQAAEYLDEVWKASLVRVSDEFRSMFITTFNRDNSMVVTLVLCEEILSSSSLSAPAKLVTTVLEAFDKFYWSICTVLNELNGVSVKDIEDEADKIEAIEAGGLGLTRILAGVGAIYMAGGSLVEGVTTMWKAHENETPEVIFSPRSEGDVNLRAEYTVCRSIFLELGLVSSEGIVASEEDLKNIFNKVLATKFKYSGLEEATRGGLYEYIMANAKANDSAPLFNNPKEYASMYLSNPDMNNFITTITPSDTWGGREDAIKAGAVRSFVSEPDEDYIEEIVFKAATSAPVKTDGVSAATLLTTLVSKLTCEPVPAPVAPATADPTQTAEWDGVPMTENFTAQDIMDGRVDVDNVGIERLQAVDPRIVNVVNGIVVRTVEI